MWGWPQDDISRMGGLQQKSRWKACDDQSTYLSHWVVPWRFGHSSKSWPPRLELCSRCSYAIQHVLTTIVIIVCWYQTVISGGPFDLHRSIVLSSFGLFFHGPAGHIIYDNLDKVIDGKGPKEIAAKIMVDQMIWWYVDKARSSSFLLPAIYICTLFTHLSMSIFWCI